MELKDFISGNVLHEATTDTIKALLIEAVKKNVNCSRADLRRADLRGAYLGGAYLGGAYLGGTDLGGTYLTKGETKINWNSHDLVGEILWREAGENIERKMLAAFIGRNYDWCWDKWTKFQHPERKWALNALRDWVVDGDDAPKILHAHNKTTE